LSTQVARVANKGTVAPELKPLPVIVTVWLKHFSGPHVILDGLTLVIVGAEIANPYELIKNNIDNKKIEYESLNLINFNNFGFSLSNLRTTFSKIKIQFYFRTVSDIQLFYLSEIRKKNEKLTLNLQNKSELNIL
jgi:hypothetical protein